MNVNELATLQSQAIFLTFKAGFLVILFMLGIFFLVVLKQIRSMNAIITQPDLSPYLEFFTYLLILGDVALFIVAIVIL